MARQGRQGREAPQGRRDRPGEISNYRTGIVVHMFAKISIGHQVSDLANQGRLGEDTMRAASCASGHCFVCGC